ncbi:MAG: prepilin-type N-terminal cleavage/methylation domain-containing protein [Phycisphaerae bacterium]|jgi:prepilin-type N-terminal cleavage/methylation domain-containing protein
MKISKQQTGVTLIEILVVVVIIAILAAMVIGIASRIEIQGKDRVIKNTLELLDAALGEFGDYGYNFKGSYSQLKFPPDCNGFLETNLEAAFQDALGATSTPIDGGTHDDPNYSGSEVMYFFLDRVPESKKILDKIGESLITQKGSNGSDMEITVNPGAADEKKYPLLRVIDPWGKTLRYSYYRNTQAETTPSSEPEQDSPRTFPVIISAGPDGVFGTDDDIKSRE